MNDKELLIELGRKLSTFMDEEKAVVGNARIENPWFNEDAVRTATKQWTLALEEGNVVEWLNQYTINPMNKKVGIIMAGNIPFVGLHDLLSVLVTGATAICKLSSNDQVLMKWVILTLHQLDSALKERVVIAEERLTGIEALIATGSNNSSRYFEYYFKDIPRLIRKNRSSVAIIDSKDTVIEYKKLASDIFTYFGLGCRNVGKVFLPTGFDIVKLIDNFEGYSDIQHHHKYANNYTYHKAILLMNLDKHLDNGFLILQEKENELKAPLSQLFYAFYEDKNELINTLKQSDEIQCIVGSDEGLIPFGDSQKPSLLDYADQVDTVEFVLGAGSN